MVSQQQLNYTTAAVGNSTPLPSNTSQGGNQTDALSEFQIILPTVIYNLVIVVGVVGNGTLIRLISTSRSMRRRTMNLYILNIAAADLALLLLGLVDGTLYALDRGWLLGSRFCKVYRTIPLCCLYVSILSLVAVAIERYCAVVYPLKAHALLGHSRVRHTIILIWIMAALCSSPVAIFNQTESNNGKVQCYLKLAKDRELHSQRRLIYKYIEFGIFFALPLLIQLILYSIIARKLTERQRRRRSLSDDTERPLEEPARGESEVDHKSRQVIRMLTTCVLVYFISYMPMQVLLFYETATGIPFHATWPLRVTLTTLIYINSAANPIIYYACNKFYRKKITDMYCRSVCCRTKCCRRWAERRAMGSLASNSSRSGRRSTTTTHSLRLTSLR